MNRENGAIRQIFVRCPSEKVLIYQYLASGLNEVLNNLLTPMCIMQDPRKNFEKSEVEEMHAKNVMGTAQTERIASVVVIAKKVRSLPFCVFYRKSNAVTVQDSY